MCALRQKIAPVTFVFPKYKMRDTNTNTEGEGGDFPKYQCQCIPMFLFFPKKC